MSAALAGLAGIGAFFALLYYFTTWIVPVPPKPGPNGFL